MAVRDRDLTQLSTGLDALETPTVAKVGRGRRIWRAAWPKLLAVGLALAVWQFLVWIHWKETYQLPPPAKVFGALFDDRGLLWESTLTTLGRAVKGFAIALVIGVVIGALVSRIAILRAAIGSMITGLQLMPSVAWFPAALVLFQLTEGAIIFVVVLGAAPSIANGLINGIDHIPPVLIRAGRVMGAHRFAAFRYVILPAALPAFIGGLKQGWAFAWRSLLAGELLVVIPGTHSLGFELQFFRENLFVNDLYAGMIVIFVIGILVDTFVFGFAERAIRRRYGLVDQALAT